MLGARRGTSRRRLLAVASVGAALLVLAPLVPAAGLQHTTAGCSPTRHAIAYDSTGAQLPTPPTSPPVPCEVATGFSTVETHVVVTADGSVVQEPAVVTPGVAGTAYLPGAPGPRPQQPTSPAGIAVSSDQGANWSFVQPAGSYWTANDAALYTDRVTGRLFEETLSPGQVPEPTGSDLAPHEQAPGAYAYLLASPDDGAHWSHTALPGFVFTENPRFTAAPPTAGPAPAGTYPDRTYWCGNHEIGLTEPLILERECYRSLDGGESWERRSILFTNPVPQHPECGTQAEDIDSVDGNYPQGAGDGSLYVMVSCGGTVFLARSTDEAATFPIVHTPSGQPLTLPVGAHFGWPELRVERQVNGTDALFLIYQTSGHSLQVKVSSDGGNSWISPVTLTPTGPAGLASIDRWAAAARGPEIAVSYLSPSRTASSGFDGYVSETADALASAPVVWTATINDPSQGPMLTSAPQDAKDDYIGVDIAPDGTPWASFSSSCDAESPSKAADATACAPAQGTSVNGGNERGIVGRLAS